MDWHIERMRAAAQDAAFDLETLFAKHPVPKGAKLGSASPHRPLLDLRNYVEQRVQLPPSVHRRLPLLGDAFLNDAIGDCGEVMAIQAFRAFHSEARTPIPNFVGEDASDFYTLVGGYDPSQIQPDGSNPTDNGTDNDVLVEKLKSPGLHCAADDSYHKIEASVFVDPSDPYLTKVAIWEFVVCFRAYGLPLTAQAAQGKWQMPTDLSLPESKPGSWGYHDIPLTSYGPHAVGFPTWGLPWVALWDFDTTFATQSFVVVTKEMKTLQGVSPAGINWTKLNADLAALPPATH